MKVREFIVGAFCLAMSVYGIASNYAIKNYPLALSLPSIIVTDSKGNAWLSSYVDDTSIIKIPANGESPVFYSDEKYNFLFPLDIVVDLQDNIWVSQATNSVTEIPKNNPDQPIVYTDKKYQFNNPDQMVVDPNGNVWIMNDSGNSITKVPANAPDEPSVYPITPCPQNYGDVFTVDPQGNIWIVAPVYNFIVEIPVARPEKEIVYSGANYQINYPSQIVADPLGNIWVLNDNSVTELPVLHPDQPIVYSSKDYQFHQTYKMLIDHQGNVWVFNDFNMGEDDRLIEIPAEHPNQPIIYSGEKYPFSHYPIRDIAVDPNNNVWVTSTDNKGIDGGVTEISANNPNQPILYFGKKYHFRTPTSLTTDNQGNIWIKNTDSVTKLVLQ